MSNLKPLQPVINHHSDFDIEVAVALRAAEAPCCAHRASTSRGALTETAGPCTRPRIPMSL